MNTDLKIAAEEELRRRVARGEERDLHTEGDLKSAAEETARRERARQPKRRKAYRQHEPIPT